MQDYLILKVSLVDVLLIIIWLVSAERTSEITQTGILFPEIRSMGWDLIPYLPVVHFPMYKIPLVLEDMSQSYGLMDLLQVISFLILRQRLQLRLFIVRFVS